MDWCAQATKHQLKKFPSVFGSSKASLRGSATNASGADNQHAHTVVRCFVLCLGRTNEIVVGDI